MSIAWPSLDVETVCALGIGGVLLGLYGLLFGPIVRGRGEALAVGALGLGWAVGLPVALALHLEPIWWLPLLVLLTVTRGLAALRSPVVGRVTLASLRLCSRARAQAGCLLLLSPLCLAWYAEHLERTLAPRNEDYSGLVEEGIQLAEEAAHWAFTDAGRSLPLFVSRYAETDAPARSADDTAYLQNRRLNLSVIRNDPATDVSNCHGWVFTGGRYWLRGSWVDWILEDNGYCPVETPAIGDLAVYRDDQGQVAHSGVVCGFTSGHEILIESKWGRLGRYIHRTDQHAYSGTICTYYHSPRAGHLLWDFVEPARSGDLRAME
jgi:hypothetical protein